jgi:dihydrodipicolinate synthase/N-acetylneuraminate lyase
MARCNLAKLTRQNLRGIWYALIVPWTQQGQLDEQRFVSHIRSFANTGVHGVYTGGTTGEFYAQDDELFERITSSACETAHACGLPIQIGVTALATRWTIQRVAVAARCGADAVQVALPFWLELRDDEAMRFLREVAAAHPQMPLVLYHTSRAKRKLSPGQIGQLAREIPSFVGMKDTGCTVEQLKAMLEAAPELSIFGGEGDLAEKMRAGGTGSYSAVAGMTPWRVAELYEHLAAGRFDAAAPIQRDIKRMLDQVLIPICVNDGLEDSAIDRVQRVAGGWEDVDLQCQSPYRSGTQQHVQRVVQWCRDNAPAMLQRQPQTTQEGSKSEVTP